ncbi:MAG: 50S ribosomal protein L4, partial [Candidatus Micrarchaeaceae archaeon]
LSEQSFEFQPQGHYILAGMQTTATYYGRMSTYRTGRHMGIAIRPREKLGGGRQGKVKRIPSAVKGKRAHPHKITKKIVEIISKKEYANALKSAIAATVISNKNIVSPIIVDDNIENLKRAKDVSTLLKQFHIPYREGKKKILNRSHNKTRYKSSAIIIVNNDKGIIKAARNLPGIDAVTLAKLKVKLLAPGGQTSRIAIWSESAVNNVSNAISKLE